MSRDQDMPVEEPFPANPRLTTRRPVKSPLIAGWAVLLLVLHGGSARAATYELDSVHSHILFAVSHLGFSNMIGLFDDFSGTFDFDASHLEGSRLDVSVNTESIKTNNAQRDGDLKGPDWFNVATYPAMTFKGRTFERTGETTGRIIGDLTIIGNTRPVTLDVTLNKEGTSPFDKSHVAGFSARGRINRNDFGLKTYPKMIGDDVTITIEAEGHVK